MKPASVVVAGMTSILVGATVFACAAPTADETETVGETSEALSRTDPKPFTCSGNAGVDPNNGKEMFYVLDCTGKYGVGLRRGECVCIVEEQCGGWGVDGGPGVICNGFSYVSTYACPPLFPYQRCNSFGACSCNPYPN